MNHCIHRLHHLQTLDNHVVYGKEVNAFNMLHAKSEPPVKRVVCSRAISP